MAKKSQLQQTINRLREQLHALVDEFEGKRYGLVSAIEALEGERDARKPKAATEAKP